MAKNKEKVNKAQERALENLDYVMDYPEAPDFVEVISRMSRDVTEMPSYKVKQAGENGKSEYQDICYPVIRAFREKLYGAVTEAYELEKEGKTTDSRKTGGKGEGSSRNFLPLRC